jgi:hypothetical protein
MLSEENAAVDMNNGVDVAGPGEIAVERSLTPAQDHGLLSRLAESPAVRKAVLALSTFIGGAGITSLSGCAPDGSYNNQVGVVRMLEKEAKFSTLATDAKIALPEMPKLLEEREALVKTIDEAIPQARELVTNFEADGVLPQGRLESFKPSLIAVERATASALAQESFAPVKEKLAELSARVAAIQSLAEMDFAQGTQSVGYSKTNAVMQSLYDWSTALDRDVVNLKAGVYALKVATLSEMIQKTEGALKTVDTQESVSKWISAHPQEATTMGESIAATITTLSTNANDPVFVSLGDDLRDLKTLLMDLSKVFPTPTAEAFPTSADAKSEKALVKETIALVAAIRADLEKELTNTIGAKSEVKSPQSTDATAKNVTPGGGSPATQVTHHHHDSGSNMMLWYMLLNNNRGYGSGYTYVPNHTPSYSGASRLRTSPEYSSFAHTSSENHSTFGGRSGFSSHSSGPLGRAAPSAPSVSSGGFKSSSGFSAPSHSSSPSHVGGFNAGRSSSAGFGG